MENWNRKELIVSLDEPDEAFAESLRDLRDALFCDSWVPGPPQFIDGIEDERAFRQGDDPVYTFGLVLSVLAPLSGNERMSQPEDQQQFLQTERFLAEMSEYSIQTGARLRVYYDGEEIGEIAGRDLSRGIVDGLLAPWRKQVGLK